MSNTIKRRKPVTWRREVVEMTPAMAKAHMAYGRICAWDVCENYCDGDLPPDWANLLTWWSPQPVMKVEDIVLGPFCTRDAVLCGQHARELESLLKTLPDRRLEGSIGSA
jgi:hypothetical protein